MDISNKYITFVSNINKKNMSQLEIAKEFLLKNRGYLKKSPYKLAERLDIENIEVAYIALKQIKQQLKNSFIKLNNPKILIYDIETSYNIVKSWRIGYNININPKDIIHERKIICVSYKWLGEDQVYNLQWDKNQDDKFLLEQFIEVLNEADLIVAHNGERYDLKFIKTRAIYQGLEMLIDYPQFDTLKVAKKKFNFNSNKLDYISEYLGFENKIKTEMKLWDDIIFNKCPKAMDKMIEYCNMDVILLEKVYNRLVHWEKPKYHFGVLNGLSKETSPIEGGLNLELVKTVTTNRGTLKRIMKDLDTNRLFEMSETSYKKYIDNK